MSNIPSQQEQFANIRALVSRKLPHEPSKSIGPVDHVQMAHVFECSFICPPLTAGNADESIIVALDPLDDAVRLSEHGPKPRGALCPVRIIRDPFTIGRFWVEFFLHVLLGELTEGTSFEANKLE